MNPAINYNTLGHQTHCRPAFTLIELVIVILLVSILAVTVIPAIQTLDDARVNAAAQSLKQRLILARATAIATGRPTGLNVDPSSSFFQLLYIPVSTTNPIPLLNAMGEPDPGVNLIDTYSTTIDDVTLGDGSSGAGVLWFGYDGTPELRDSSGNLLGPATSTAIIDVATPPAWTVLVHDSSGAIEVLVP